MFNLVLQTKDIKEAKRHDGLLEIRFPHPKEKALLLKLRHAVLSIETGWPIPVSYTHLTLPTICSV